MDVFRHRLLVVVAGLAASAGAALPSSAGAPAPPSAQASAPVIGPTASVTHAPTDLAAVRANLRREARGLRRERRRTRLHELRGRRTVGATLERATLRHELTRAQFRGARRTLAAARQTAGQTGSSELAMVLSHTRALAEAGRLHANRVPAQMLTLRRNTTAVRTGTMPADRERVRFPGDPIVYERYSGEGLQIQWLGTWGKANWKARRCLESPRTCRRRALARTMDRLVALGSSRGGFLAFEYRFSFGGGNPPWISAITQGTAAQALARAGKALHKPRYARFARSAIGAFATPPPVGVAVPAAGGSTHYLMYSFAPSLRILNGHVQALVALHDVATLAGSRRARALFRRGERSGAARLRAYDTGAWSLYSAGGSESTLGYHELVAGFLANLCQRVPHSSFCGAGRRFARYEREPPRLHITLPTVQRERRAATLVFELSKGAAVSARAEGPSGTTLLTGARLGRGDHAVRWTPRQEGRYRIVFDTTGPAGNRGRMSRTVEVLPKPRPKRRPRDRRSRRQHH